MFSSIVSFCATDLESQVRVRGYYRKNGTYVRPHVRTRPDGNPYNNYSFPGNYNPNTGRTTKGNPETYLRNYYKKSNNDKQVNVQGYYRKDGTYVQPHVRTKPDGNPYNNYSFPGNYNPNTDKITKGDPDTYLKNYYNKKMDSKTDNLVNYTSQDKDLNKSASKEHKHSAPQEFEKEYQAALKLYEQYQYAEAIAKFSSLLNENSHVKLADNSQYWLGECHYGLRDYHRSITEFKKVFAFRDNDKYDDTYLKLGLCYLKIGNREQAKHYFTQLLINFPQSEYAGKAENFLNKI